MSQVEVKIWIKVVKCLEKVDVLPLHQMSSLTARIRTCAIKGQKTSVTLAVLSTMFLKKKPVVIRYVHVTVLLREWIDNNISNSKYENNLQHEP